MQSKTGIPLLSKPDLLAEPEIAAEVGVVFMDYVIKKKVGDNWQMNDEFLNLDSAIKFVARANSGWKSANYLERKGTFASSETYSRFLRYEESMAMDASDPHDINK